MLIPRTTNIRSPPRGKLHTLTAQLTAIDPQTCAVLDFVPSNCYISKTVAAPKTTIIYRISTSEPVISRVFIDSVRVGYSDGFGYRPHFPPPSPKGNTTGIYGIPRSRGVQIGSAPSFASPNSSHSHLCSISTHASKTSPLLPN
jgi:hypothetical protein